MLLLLACLVPVVGFVWVMLTATAMGLDDVPDSDLRLAEWHHAYLGWLLMVASWWTGWWTLAPGLLLAWDDCVQHAVQLFTRRLAWHGPLARGYAFLYTRVPFLRRVNAWLDGVLR